MMMNDRPPEPLGSPDIRARRPRFSLVWLVPLSALLIGITMVAHNYLSSGPVIQISFETAEGLEANKTQVKYKNVVIGRVIALQLSDDHTRVLASIELGRNAKPFTREDSRYWVVRPRVGADGISGVGTLLSGPFIAADIGSAPNSSREFVGLEAPPPLTFGTEGRRFILRTKELGSLEVGSPVYYRRLQVGQVVSYALADDGRDIDLEVFIKAPYYRFVSVDSRFWNTSGIDVTLGAEGLQLNTQSLSSILSGGIAFRTPEDQPDVNPAEEGRMFTLHDSLKQAMTPDNGHATRIRLRFDQALRGLHVDAPVEFLGVPIGRVVAVELGYEPQTMSFPLQVDVLIYPRLGKVQERIREQGHELDDAAHAAEVMKMLVEKGLRAQARPGNLLTGQLYIALDFDPRAPKVTFNSQAQPLEIPTVPGRFARMEEQLQALVEKISELPIERLAANLDGSLEELRRTLGQVNAALLPQLRQTLESAQVTLDGVNRAMAEESPDREQLAATLAEVQRSARALRVLADYLGRQPEALLRGLDDPATPAHFQGATSRQLQPEILP